LHKIPLDISVQRRQTFLACLLWSLHDKEKKRRKAWGEEVQVLFLHAAFLLRLLLFSVRRFVHPAPHSQRSLLKNSPLFLEIDSYQPFFLGQTISMSQPRDRWQNFLPLDIPVFLCGISYLRDDPGNNLSNDQFSCSWESVSAELLGTLLAQRLLLVRNPSNIFQKG
jgi:hypothetical protein